MPQHATASTPKGKRDISRGARRLSNPQVFPVSYRASSDSNIRDIIPAASTISAFTKCQCFSVLSLQCFSVLSLQCFSVIPLQCFSVLLLQCFSVLPVQSKCCVQSQAYPAWLRPLTLRTPTPDHLVTARELLYTSIYQRTGQDHLKVQATFSRYPAASQGKGEYEIGTHLHLIRWQVGTKPTGQTQDSQVTRAQRIR